MKKVRIGKTMELSWRITTNGESQSLSGRDLTLVLKDPTGELKIIPYSISNTNVLVFKYQGKDQTKVGKYSLTLWENKGKENQTVVDIDAFILVSSTDKEE